MLKETKISQALRLVFASGAVLSMSMLAQPTFAQQADTTDAPVQRVEITGSSIKRIQKEGALPVQTLTQDDIKRSGVTSATDLIQNLPAMQGFTTSSMSVNGGGGGTTTAAIHALPSKYTLVLLDGQRLAGANLESIPLDAVERVEILTDGASALYGSDAIAGVVNFILKKNKTDGDAYITATDPQHPGGKGWNAGISKGFGNLNTDGYNVLLTYSHDEQHPLAASQRDFSKQGAVFNFTSGGKTYSYNNATVNTTPANITINSTYTFNPYYSSKGNCGNPLANVVIATNTTECTFNYAATVQDIPETKRDAVLVKGVYNVNDNTTLWASLLYSKVDVTAQFAPSAQPLGVSPKRLPSLYNTYIAPYLAANNLTFTSGTLNFRTIALGGRADDFQQDTTHFSAGFNTTAAGWDVNGSMTLSKAISKDIAAGGYSDYNALSAAIAAGTYDPVMNTGASTLSSTLLNGTQFSKSTSTVDAFKIGAQHDLFDLSGGKSIISLGAELTKQHDKTDYNSLILSSSGFSTQPASGDFPVGGNYGQIPYDANRTNAAISTEILLPVTNTFETTISGRYDHYGKTHSNYVFSDTPDANGVQNQIASADLGNTFGAGTYKIGMRWTPKDNLLIRGSYGTGFKAPNMSDIASPLSYGGNTSGSYVCPFPAGTLGCGSNPKGDQYDVLSGGNPASGSTGLKAENSKQWTLGFRVEPGYGLSLGADLWKVQIKNQVLANIPEAYGFAHYSQFPNLFVQPYNDLAAGVTTIAYKEQPLNGGVANYQGIDWDFSEKLKTSLGNLSTQWTGTYMMKQNYTFIPGGPVLTDLGQFGPDNQVVFRVQMRLAATLNTGNFSNTLSANYKSGYRDQTSSVSLLNADGSTTPVSYTGNVSSYTTFDWQGKYDYSKALNFTAGIRNLFDRNPPLTLQHAGGGNQVGYDGRYTDPLGRTFYLTGHYKF